MRTMVQAAKPTRAAHKTISIKGLLAPGLGSGGAGSLDIGLIELKKI